MPIKTSEKPVFDFYLSPGEFLNDKDSRINSDKRDLDKFLEPIDKLFGDYETLKKFKLDRTIYKRIFEGSDEAQKIDAISKAEFDSNRGKLLILMVGQFGNELRVGYHWVKPDYDSIQNELEGIYGKIKRKVLKAVYILDPVKIYQIIDMDDQRHDSHINALYDHIKMLLPENVLVKHKNAILKSIQDHASKINAGNSEALKKNSFLNILNFGQDSFSQQEVSVVNQILECEKVKKFQKFKALKFRIGRYDDGRYVIFLHPYDSETNCPGKIPTSSSN